MPSIMTVDVVVAVEGDMLLDAELNAGRDSACGGGGITD